MTLERNFSHDNASSSASPTNASNSENSDPLLTAMNEHPTENITAPTKKTTVISSLPSNETTPEKKEERGKGEDNITDTTKFSTLPLFHGARQMIHSLSHSRKKPKEELDGQTDTTLVPLPILSNSRRFGPYEIVAEIERKPLGNSYKARHVTQDRMYFLKILTSDLIQSQQLEDRIKRTRRLVHPRIINYTDYGNLEGFFYIAAEFVEGETLQAKMEKFLSLRESLDLIHSILTILEYAHHQEIYHGTLSPTNIFITPEGTLKITDFALPVLLNPSLVAFSPESLGYQSLYYTEPSRIKSPLGLDFASDIYAVGAILYELVTEQKIFTGDTFGKLLKNVENAVPLYSFEPSVPAEIRAIIRKATFLKREKRYSNIRMFAQDVENVLHFRPIVGAKLYPFESWLATHSHASSIRWGLGLFSVFFFLFFSGVLFGPLLFQKKNASLEELQSVQKEYQAFQAEAFLEKAKQLQTTHLEIAGLFAASAYQKLPNEEARSLLSTIHLQRKSTFKKYLSAFAPFSTLDSSVDSTLFFTVDPQYGVQEWEGSTGAWRRNLLPISTSFSEANGPFAQDSNFFYITQGQDVFEYRKGEEKSQKTFYHQEPITRLFLTPESLFTGSVNGTIVWWDRLSGSKIIQQTLGEKPIRALVFEKNNQLLFVASENRIVGYSLKNKKALLPLFDFSPHRLPITQLKIHHSLPFLFSAGLDHRIHAIDLKTGNLVHSFIGHQNGIVDFCWNEDASALYSLAEKGEVFHWAIKPVIQSNAPQETFHFPSVQSQKICLISPKRLALLTDGHLRFLETSPFQVKIAPHYAVATNSHTLFSLTAEKIYTGDTQGQVVSWDVSTQKPLQLFSGANRAITALAFDPSSKMLWAGDISGFLFGWAISEESPKINWTAHSTAIISLASDQKFVYSSSTKELLCVEMLSGPRILWKAPPASSLVLDSAKGKLWASSTDGVLRCYHTQQGTELGQWKISTQPLFLQNSPHSSKEICLSTGNQFFVWNTQKEQIQEEYAVSDTLCAGTLSESFVFLSTQKHFFVFRRGEQKPISILTSPETCRQLSYIPEKQSLLCRFSEKGLGEWPDTFFISTEWWSPLYWEAEAKGHISGLKFIPSASSKPQK